MGERERDAVADDVDESDDTDLTRELAGHELAVTMT